MSNFFLFCTIHRYAYLNWPKNHSTLLTKYRTKKNEQREREREEKKYVNFFFIFFFFSQTYLVSESEDAGHFPLYIRNHGQASNRSLHCFFYGYQIKLRFTLCFRHFTISSMIKVPYEIQANDQEKFNAIDYNIRKTINRINHNRSFSSNVLKLD